MVVEPTNEDRVMTWEISYTGYDGYDRSEEFTGTLEELRTHLTFLEEHGCHMISAFDEAGEEIPY
jgi:hypothetical protein